MRIGSWGPHGTGRDHRRHHRLFKGEIADQASPDGEGVFVTSLGASANGTFPLLGRLDLKTGATTRLWQAGADYFEVPMALGNEDGTSLITRREDKDTPPNYYLRPLTGGTPKVLTNFPDPAPQFAGVTKQTIPCSRADGVKLSGTLYLPASDDKGRDGPLPMLMWAYPEEFTDASVASQSLDYGNRFMRPAATSPLFLLTQGYAVLDGPSMPIIGANGAQL